MVGYPGAGKTTVSKVIAKHTGAIHLWADHERRQKDPEPTYSDDETKALYERLNTETSELLHKGKSVVFDTNFNYKKDRDYLRQIASRNGARTVVVWIRTPKPIAKKRAVHEAHLHHTRILGSMPEASFDRLASDLETPDTSESPIILDGTELSEQDIVTALQL